MRPHAVQGGVFGFLGRHLVFAGFLLVIVEFAVAGLIANTDAVRNRALLSAAGKANVPPGWARGAPTKLSTENRGAEASWAARAPAGATGPRAAGDVRRWMASHGYRLGRAAGCGADASTCRLQAAKGSYVLSVSLPVGPSPDAGVSGPVPITLRRRG